MSRRGVLALSLAMLAATTLVVWGVIEVAAARDGTVVDEIADTRDVEDTAPTPSDTPREDDPAAAAALPDVASTLPDVAGLLLLVGASLGCALVLLRPPE